MGVADSPLRDGVVFVEGAPRSGTSWLAAVLATHPEIAGVSSESHLFDLGIDRVFDNYELSEAWSSYLVNYVSREQLVDLVREFCDGVLVGMRERTKPEARYVVEKTPLGPSGPYAQIQRKRECFPDGWYLHIVRDGRAVTESLMRAPFVSDRSPVANARRWREAVNAVRAGVGDHPRYRELRYEDMRADPVAAAESIFEWLDIARDRDVLERVRQVSSERYAGFEAREEGRLGAFAYAWARALDTGGRVARRASSMGPPRVRRTAGRSDVAARFLWAARQGDLAEMRSLGTDELVVELPPGSGGKASGDAGLEALASLMSRVFARRYVNADWHGADGVPFVTITFAGMRGDGSTVEIVFHVFVRRRRVSGVRVIASEQV